MNLKFDEEPKYAAYSNLFEPLCGATLARPILQTDVPKVWTGTSYQPLLQLSMPAGLNHVHMVFDGTIYYVQSSF